jgi:D-tyrosyl-tRNA(Tyr) deacylase
MRIVLQRVKSASVGVADDQVASIGKGFLALIAFSRTDSEEVLQWMARKMASLRLFEDDDGKMNRDLAEVDGGLLVVSQFTLYGDCTKGKRPSFDKSARADQAEVLYERFLEILREEAPCEVRTGAFQEHMTVSLVNDGPVTVILQRESV